MESRKQLLEMKRDTLRQALEITGAWAEAGGPDAYADMVTARQAVLDQAKAIEEQLAAFGRDPLEDPLLAALAAESDDLIRAILRREEENNRARAAVMDTLRKDIKALKDQKRANAHYQDTQLVGVSFFDKMK